MDKRCDIFCKIVDNFGDIGVSWRLARQLATEHGLKVRLWVDNIALAQQFARFYNADIEICHWHETADFTQAADVAIETFSCGLPEAYQQAMQARQSAWVNVEYLSAEDWVEDFHGRPSPQANGLVRHFFYPGFTAKTGGLIRETSRKGAFSFEGDNINVSLFCYPHAPVGNLLQVFAESAKKIVVHVPETRLFPQLRRIFDVQRIAVGDVLQRDNLTVKILPFLSQDDYDALLGACDLNFVRGEDSWVRAIWAGRPFIWQPYLQAEDAHLVKLHAFLHRFYANYEQKEMLCKAHEYWVSGHGDSTALREYLHHLALLQGHTQRQSATLAKQTDLATNLVIYIEKLIKTRV